jgi:hypothetical protein
MIREFLQTMVRARKELGARVKGYRFCCIEEFVCEYGREFAPAPLPDRLRKGLPRHCYHNAYHLARKHGLVYVEGYAAGLIPVLHAWCCAPGSTQVIDPTWGQDIG